MGRTKAAAVWSGVVTLSVFFGVCAGSWANNRWYCWKYLDANVSFYNGASNVGSKLYKDYYEEEARTDSNAWDPYTEINLTPSGEGSTDHCNCYSGAYGINNWLGLAEIASYSGCTILRGNCYLNRSYLDSSSYSATNVKHVACQEVGHLWGLDHQRGKKTTCMNDLILNKPFPNSHDQSMVNSIY